MKLDERTRGGVLRILNYTSQHLVERTEEEEDKSWLPDEMITTERNFSITVRPEEGNYLFSLRAIASRLVFLQAKVKPVSAESARFFYGVRADAEKAYVIEPTIEAHSDLHLEIPFLEQIIAEIEGANAVPVLCLTPKEENLLYSLPHFNFKRRPNSYFVREQDLA